MEGGISQEPKSADDRQCVERQVREPILGVPFVEISEAHHTESLSPESRDLAVRVKRRGLLAVCRRMRTQAQRYLCFGFTLPDWLIWIRFIGISMGDWRAWNGEELQKCAVLLPHLAAARERGTSQTADLHPQCSTMIRFLLLQNKQGRTRLSKWFVPFSSESDRARIEAEIHSLVVARDRKYSNFLEFHSYKLVYRRYAGLYFTIACDIEDNELSYLEAIHLFVEVLDSYFNNVCELDIGVHAAGRVHPCGRGAGDKPPGHHRAPCRVGTLGLSDKDDVNDGGADAGRSTQCERRDAVELGTGTGEDDRRPADHFTSKC
eukprot:scaffold145_cov261-Pinguiococcus_pyrenoidosus.AAC.23